MSADNGSLISARSLSHSFDYQLFSDIDLDIKESESIAILGVSGSGKSTLLHILSTLLRPNKGAVFYKGKSLYKQKNDELIKIRRDQFGIIFQSHYLFKGFSVKENLEISSILSKQKIDYALLEELGIENTLNQNVSNLSGGQQQRVSIARVMMKKPKMIFADELTGNLDSKSASVVMDYMIRYVKNEGAGLFVVTHDTSVANRCDKIYRLQNGSLEIVKE
jgi:putative ABC transport system ATP-binding protein